MKTRTKATALAIIAFFTNIFHGPSDAYALAVATKLTNKEAVREHMPLLWTKKVSKTYARFLIHSIYPEWNRSEFTALSKLWGKESAWNPKAKNKHSSAFGIPQLLKLDPETPAPLQIERGLEYIKHRYEKPSVAWSHWRKHGWY